MAGMFISREIIALWDKRLPFSTISPFNKGKTITQLGSVDFVMTISLEPLHVREADPSFVKYNFGIGTNIRRAGSQLGTVTLASDIYVPGYHHYVWVQEFNAYEYSYTNNDNSVIPLRLSMDCNHINENCYIYISFAPVDVGAGGLWMCKSELYIKNIKFLIK